MRLLFVSKFFWPVSGETELLASSLACEFAQHGHDISVLSWRMVRQWPEQFQMDGCKVIRVPTDQRAGWAPAALGYYSRNRWHRHLPRWVSRHASEFDAAIVVESESKNLAATIALANAKIPTISRVRIENVFPASRQMLRELASIGEHHVRFATPDHDLFHHPEFAQSPLEGATIWVPDGWPETEPRGSAIQKKQRRVLGRVHPIFNVDESALLAICGSELTFESGVFSLVRAWRRVLAAHPNSKLWLLGSGANTNELFQRICDLEMQHSVLLPGTFDEIRDVLAAADAYIMPGRQDRLSWYTTIALQLGLTLVHHQDAPVTNEFRAPHRSLPFDDSTRSIDLVLSRWANANRAELLEGQSPSTPNEVPTMTAMVKRYLKLIESMKTQSGLAH